jgi:hypothetical protein
MQQVLSVMGDFGEIRGAGTSCFAFIKAYLPRWRLSHLVPAASCRREWRVHHPIRRFKRVASNDV